MSVTIFHELNCDGPGCRASRTVKVKSGGGFDDGSWGSWSRIDARSGSLKGRWDVCSTECAQDVLAEFYERVGA